MLLNTGACSLSKKGHTCTFFPAVEAGSSFQTDHGENVSLCTSCHCSIFIPRLILVRFHLWFEKTDSNVKPQDKIKILNLVNLLKGIRNYLTAQTPEIPCSCFNCVQSPTRHCMMFDFLGVHFEHH